MTEHNYGKITRFLIDRNHLLAGLLLTQFLSCAAPLTNPEDLRLEADGRSYHVRRFRETSAGPTIVLESGIAAKVGHWDGILPALSRIAPVFAYERPGIGGSPDDPQFNSAPEQVAQALRALLRRADMPKPYLLVGHSLGGIYAKAFVDRYPHESAGLVLIDPTDFLESWEDWGRLFDQMGVGREGQRLFRSELDRLYRAESAAVEREWRMIEDLRRNSFASLPAVSAVRSMPVRFILGTRIGPAPAEMNLPDGFSFEEYQRLFMEHRHRNIWSWVEQLPDCRVVITTGSGHFVHQDEPDLVVREIAELYARWRQ